MDKQYIATIARRVEDSAWSKGKEEILRELKFRSPTIQGAKSRVTRAINNQVFGTDWDGGQMLGTEERWRPWKNGLAYQQKGGEYIEWCFKISDTILWSFDKDKNLTKYRLIANLYWIGENPNKE